MESPIFFDVDPFWPSSTGFLPLNRGYYRSEGVSRPFWGPEMGFLSPILGLLVIKSEIPCSEPKIPC